MSKQQFFNSGFWGQFIPAKGGQGHWFFKSGGLLKLSIPVSGIAPNDLLLWL